MKVVLDADLLIGALDHSDPHHAAARKLFSGWHEQGVTRTISAVNLTEVLIAPAGRRASLTAAREAISALGVEVHRPSEAIAVDAARLRGRHPISLPDSYCVATAKYTKARIASFDHKVIRAAASEKVAAEPAPSAVESSFGAARDIAVPARDEWETRERRVRGD